MELRSITTLISVSLEDMDSKVTPYNEDSVIAETEEPHALQKLEEEKQQEQLQGTVIENEEYRPIAYCKLVARNPNVTFGKLKCNAIQLSLIAIN